MDEEWQVSVARIQRPAATPETIEAITMRFPWQARIFVEEVLLPRWASEEGAGDRLTAARWLSLATTIASTLAKTRGEELTAEAVLSIRTTMDRGSANSREALLRGLQDFGVGVAHFNVQQPSKDALTRSARDLAQVGNPLRFWTRFYLAVTEYYDVDASRGLALLDGLLAELPERRYPALVGRASWVAGNIDKVRGRIQSSVHRYERAVENLRRSGGDSAVAFTTVLLAESYSLIGEDALAWQSRQRAFREVPLNGTPRHNIAMWTEAAEALMRNGNAYLAGPLLEEAVAEAERWHTPFGRATAYIDRATFRIENGDRANAMADLLVAKTAASAIEDISVHNDTMYRINIAEGLWQLPDMPARSADLLLRGLAGQAATGTKFDAITYTTVLARAQLAAGNIALGAATLERAIGIFEDIRSTVEDPVSRMQAFRQAQPAFDRLIELRATSLPNEREAFLLAERSRGRVLLEMAGRNGGTLPDRDSFVSLTDLEQILPAQTALTSYAVLDNRVLAWVVERGRSRRLWLKTSRADLKDKIERFRLRLTTEDDVAAIRASAEPLYDALIRPLGLGEECSSLIIVPDRWLARLPFAALFDRNSGRYLIEQRTVTVTPSATLLVRGSQAPRPSKPGNTSAVILGVSRGGSYRGTMLPELMYADREAAAVATVYPGSMRMKGSQATRKNFLRMSVSSDVIHFAGHSVVDLNAPRRSVLLFAGDVAHPLDPLSLGELFDAGVGNAKLVVLSSCRAQDSLGDDREGLLGLAGAFVAAGVSEVVASPLDIHDELEPRVMAAFHRQYRKHRSARIAFREAVMELLSSGPSDVRSPAAWGGLTVIEGRIENGGSEQ